MRKFRTISNSWGKIYERYARWLVFIERKEMTDDSLAALSRARSAGDPDEREALNLIRRGSRKFFRMALDRSDRYK